jgi:glycosyltransferase involved in cell wall biosynthesis
MRCKKIFLINAGEPLPIDGNKPHRMSHWMTKLSKLGHDITFFTTDFEHQRKVALTEENVPQGYRLLQSRVGYNKNVSLWRLVNHYYLGRSLKRALWNSEKPDLIICSYPTINMSYVATVYGKKNKIPVLIDVRDLWPDIFINSIAGRFLLFPLFKQKNFTFNNATVITGVSPDYVRWANFGSSSPVNTLPLSQYKLTKKESVVLNNANPLRLIFVGTLGDTYDLALISTISKLLTSSKISHQINVCGDGPQKESFLESISDIPEVNYLGWLRKEQLDLDLRRSHVGLMLYKKSSPQGWPNKLIEYMSYGMPIINSLPGESWSLIQENQIGINIESSHLEPIIDWVTGEIIPNYQSNSERALKVFNDYFDEETTFNKLLNIIENVTTNS